jgi:hypothetical protein
MDCTPKPGLWQPDFLYQKHFVAYDGVMPPSDGAGALDGACLKLL